MQTKLTLRLEQRLIEQTKAFARHQNKSLSQLVEEYFLLLTKITDEEVSGADEELPPITQSLLGILAGNNTGESDYRMHLEEKYL